MNQLKKLQDEYMETIGGDPIGLTVPYGYPEGVEEMGGPAAVYRECLKRGISWETLLGIEDPDDGAII